VTFTKIAVSIGIGIATGIYKTNNLATANRSHSPSYPSDRLWH